LHSARVKAAFGKEVPQSAPQLRPFQDSDLQDAYQLDQACFPPGVAYSRSELGAYVRMRNAKAWVAELTERGEPSLAGFVIGCRDGCVQGHIITVDVAPDWRRRGVGSMLMDAVENWMRDEGGEMVYLETAEDNLPAQSFYLKRGYAKLRRVEGYYADGAAAWLMAKNLPGKSEQKAAAVSSRQKIVGSSSRQEARAEANAKIRTQKGGCHTGRRNRTDLQKVR
jgi:ribosomal-protein-alanine N-acetyltransferase